MARSLRLSVRWSSTSSGVNRTANSSKRGNACRRSLGVIEGLHAGQSPIASGFEVRPAYPNRSCGKRSSFLRCTIRDSYKDGTRRRHPDRRQRAGVRPVHESPLPGGEASRPRRDVRHRHADQQHHGRALHDAAVPRPGGVAEPRYRALRRLGGDVRRGGRYHGNLARRSQLASPQPLREIHQPARAATDVPGVRRRADGGHARSAPAESGGRQGDRHRLPDVGGAGPASSRAGGPLRPASDPESRSPRG